MKHSHSCLVCSPLPPPPSLHRTPTYQKKAPQLLKTHWPRQGLLSKTNSNKLNQWHSLKGASFTLQTTAVSPGRRRTGTRKTVQCVSEAEKTEDNGVSSSSSSSSHALRNGLKKRGHCCCMAVSNNQYAKFLHGSSIFCPGSSRPDPLSRARGLLCYWCSSLLLHIMFVCTFQVSTWLNKLN